MLNVMTNSIICQYALLTLVYPYDIVRNALRPHRLTVRTVAFQAINRGSTPRGATTSVKINLIIDHLIQPGLIACRQAGLTARPQRFASELARVAMRTG